MKQIYPVLPIRDIVVFPHIVVPLLVGREKSISALEQVINDNKQILLVTQRDANIDDPNEEDLFSVGTLCSVLQMLKLPDGTVKVLIEGSRRMQISSYSREDKYFCAYAEDLEETGEEIDSQETHAIMRVILEKFSQYLKLNRKITEEIFTSVSQIDDPSKFADTISQHLSLKNDDKQTLLETLSPLTRLEIIHSYMENEMDVLKVENKIRGRVKKQMEKSQREYYLNEQMKAIQNELGDQDGEHNEIKEFENNVTKLKLGKEASEKALSEIKKLKQMSPMSAEATVIRNYLEWIFSLPWQRRSKISKDLAKAAKILDEEHYGLEKVKERIMEFLAVQLRSKKVKGSILCLVGPPGVGKTSLGKSIAKVTGRNFVRVALGGVRDESEIRGHRRTYIGSMPGKIIQGMKKAKTINPFFLLDEIDKLGSDWRGDPSSALLEVLDPEQNEKFSDHYMEIDYDLSEVMFVTTANTMNMPAPLLDRMEIIRISGYTEDEKVEIAKRHLIPKQMSETNIKKQEWEITHEAVRDIIRYYTRESGVRGLEREISKLMRKAILQITLKKAKKVKVTDKNLAEFLGVHKFRYGKSEEQDSVGAVTGLAWTQFGGELLTIESVLIPGKGRVTKTGKLGDVMQESIQAAENFVKSRAAHFGITKDAFKDTDIHVHVPEGATPKDGPSAGIAMVTSIVSVLTNNPIRKDIAMTGEITLRGFVLPIGGLKEKLLAALRGGIKTVLIPHENEKDLAEIPDNVKEGLEIIPVKIADEVLNHALTQPVVPIKWEKDEPVTRSEKGKKPSTRLVEH